MSAQCHPAASAGDKGGTPGWHRGPALPPTPTMHRLLLGHGLAAGRIAGLSAGRCPGCSRGGWDVPGEGHSRTGEGRAASRSPGLSWAAVLAGFSEALAHLKEAFNYCQCPSPAANCSFLSPKMGQEQVRALGHFQAQICDPKRRTEIPGVQHAQCSWFLTHS